MQVCAEQRGTRTLIHRWPSCFFVIIHPIAAFITAGTAYAGERHVATGEHFRVVCNFENTIIAREALETAEAIWPHVVKLRGANRPMTKPLEIHLYRHIKDYEAIDAKLTGGRCKNNLAFSSWDTKASYVAIQPPCSDETLAIVGLPLLTRYQIAHEAAHIAVYDAVPSYRSHSDWLSEGGAAWVAEMAIAGRNWSPGAKHDPYLGTDQYRAGRLLAEGRLPFVRHILNDECDDLGHYERYAIHWLFFRFMMTERYRKKFETVLAESRRLAGGPAYKEKLRTSVENAFGRGLVDIEAAFMRYVDALSPEWRQAARSLETHGQSWTQMAFPMRDAVAWRNRPAGKDAYRIEGSLEILPNPHRQMALLIGRSADGYVAVRFTAGVGVDVLRYDGLTGRRRRLAHKRIPAIDVGQRFDFKVAVDGARVDVAIDGDDVVRLDAGQSLNGPWGLAATAGSAGRWRAVRQKNEP